DGPHGRGRLARAFPLAARCPEAAPAGNPPAVRGRPPLPGAGAGSTAGLQPYAEERLGGASGLPTPGRHPAGDRAGSRAPASPDGATDRGPPGRPLPAAHHRQPDCPPPPPDPARNLRLELRPPLRAGTPPAAPTLGLRRRLDSGSRRGSVWVCGCMGVGETGPPPYTHTAIHPHIHAAFRGPRSPHLPGGQVPRKRRRFGRRPRLPAAGDDAPVWVRAAARGGRTGRGARATTAGAPRPCGTPPAGVNRTRAGSLARPAGGSAR